MAWFLYYYLLYSEYMKRSTFLIFSFLIGSGIIFGASAQSPANLFNEIEKSLKIGDVDTFSNWFSDNLDIDILDDSNICSKNQAKQILKKFFATYSPKNFTFIHQSGNGKIEYGIGSLVAGGESFRITIFVQTVEKKQSISQIRIEKSVEK